MENNGFHHWPTQSFYTHFDPTLLPPGTSQGRIDLEHKKRSSTEKLTGFEPVSGCLFITTSLQSICVSAIYKNHCI